MHFNSRVDVSLIKDLPVYIRFLHILESVVLSKIAPVLLMLRKVMDLLSKVVSDSNSTEFKVDL